jgi:hypothetical protein
MKELISTEDGTLYIENHISDMLSGVFIHWSIDKWSVSKVKYYKDLWHNFIAQRLECKFGSIYAIPPSQKEEKLIRMFGFTDTGLRMRGNKLLKYASKTH